MLIIVYMSSSHFIRSATHTAGASMTEDGPALTRGDNESATVSVVDLPSPDFLTNASPGHKQVKTRPVSIGAVFSMAPSVAAQMALERELVSAIALSLHHFQLGFQNMNH